ncbi:MAG: sigma-70 family RNA polymerase sigma factor [Polyangiaceae bacterium]|jgi:RNA polymerase sigma-70 factor (ECF subfamily)
MSQFYEDYFITVERAVGRVLRGADKETVTHEVFFRVMSSADLRASFRGGSLGAWISIVARNCAIDFWRRHQREQPTSPFDENASWTSSTGSFEASVEARELFERFRRLRLPAKWRGVFEARFVMQLNQAEAARRLGIHRTTLLYQELRVRQLLRNFVLGAEAE